MKDYPAIDVGFPADPDLLLAAVDDFGPIAVEERDGTLHDPHRWPQIDRDFASLISGEKHDENWARRREIQKPFYTHRNSNNFKVYNSALSPGSRASRGAPAAALLVVVSRAPWGRHRTPHDRAVLAAYRRQSRTDSCSYRYRFSVLAIAADLLGASRALGIDNDPDAIQSARETLALNPGAVRTEFEVADLNERALPEADVLTANLTGALLVRAAPLLRAAVHAGGALIPACWRTRRPAAFGPVVEARKTVGCAWCWNSAREKT